VIDFSFIYGKIYITYIQRGLFMEIRKLCINDYDEINNLWSTTPGMGMNAIDDSREGIAKYLLRNPDTSFVAVADGHVVGTILAGHDGRRGFIYHTAVSASYRNCGVGSALVDSAVAALAAEGIHKVALVAYKGNECGNAFWEKKGFAARTDLVYRNKELQH
jgi:ribosomal protein S18 acetylase RimI-like enzyme